MTNAAAWQRRRSIGIIVLVGLLVPAAANSRSGVSPSSISFSDASTLSASLVAEASPSPSPTLRAPVPSSSSRSSSSLAPTSDPPPDAASAAEKRGAARYGLGLGRFTRHHSSAAAKPVDTSNEDAGAVRRTLPPPESIRLRPRVVTLNVMVAGLSGLGKTTSCASLFESWRGESPHELGGGKGKSKSTTHVLRRSTPVVDASRHFERYDASANTILRVRIIDTPGFGNRVDHRHAVRPIARYVASCRDRQYRAETSPSLPDADAREGTDSLVHVCLYFLSPGRFLEIDRHFLKRIQREVAVVPVIAKADTMTDEEISRYRAELIHAFDRERIDAYDFDADYYRRSRRPGSLPVQQGEDVSASAPPLRRGRRPGEPLAVVSRDGLYPWGRSQAYDPEHSDLALVRDLLLSEHTERLVELAREKYGTYRARRIGMRKAGEAARYALLGLLAIRAFGEKDDGGRVAGKLQAGVEGLIWRLAKAIAASLGIGSKVEETETNDAVVGSGATMVEETPVPAPAPRRRFFGSLTLPDNSPQDARAGKYGGNELQAEEVAPISTLRWNNGLFRQRGNDALNLKSASKNGSDSELQTNPSTTNETTQIGPLTPTRRTSFLGLPI